MVEGREGHGGGRENPPTKPEFQKSIEEVLMEWRCWGCGEAAVSGKADRSRHDDNDGDQTAESAVVTSLGGPTNQTPNRRFPLTNQKQRCRAPFQPGQHLGKRAAERERRERERERPCEEGALLMPPSTTSWQEEPPPVYPDSSDVTHPPAASLWS